MSSIPSPARFGAHDVVDAMVNSGVTVFFANPGTSEIHLVAALDAHPKARPVLCLFEGVATGAADGYARASGNPAAVLLHLGPGLANGLANLHNAKKARSPMVVLVGDHAGDHQRFDTPLASDVDALAGYAAKSVRRLALGDDLHRAMVEAVREACSAPRGPVVVIANTDVMWSPSKTGSSSAISAAPQPIPPAILDRAIEALRAGPASTLVLGGKALVAQGLCDTDRIAQATDCRIWCETFNAVHERGAGVPSVDRIPYFREPATEALAPFTQVVLAGALPPVAFFASPEGRSELTAPGANIVALDAAHSPLAFLSALADRIAPDTHPRTADRVKSEAPSGPLLPKTVWASVNRHLPAGALISEEAGVSSLGADAAMHTAERHRWMNLTGGSIGQGLPVATGAAIGEPNSKVVAMHGDGGAMYTVQSLWTQARERSDVVTVILRNDRYAILDYEVKRHGLGPLGERGAGMFELGRPTLDWVALARGLGVEAVSADTAEAFDAAFAEAMTKPGPRLIEARLAPPKPKKPA